MNDLAFEAAAAHYERALGSLELVDDASMSTRFDVMLARATALNLGGDERRRRAAFDAAALARTLGDADRLARAALALVGNTSAASDAGNVDEEILGLLEEALAALPPDASPARARVLASLAAELQFAPDSTERRVALAEAAVATARATGDASALGYVLVRSWTLLDNTRPWHLEFRALMEEAEVAANETGDIRVLREATFFGVWMAAIAGDRAEFDRRFEAFARISDQMRQPRELVFRTWAEASRAHFDGRLADAERLTIEGVTAAPAADLREGQVSAFLGGLFYAIRIAQGRLDELVDTVIELVDTQPGSPVWRVALAGAFVETDQVDQAQAPVHVARGRRLRQRPERCHVRYDDVRSGTHELPRTAARRGAAVGVRTPAPVRRSLQLERDEHGRSQRPRPRDDRRRDGPAR